MSQYSFKEVAPHHLELWKWDDDYSSSRPKEVYEIRGAYCNCPARVRYCKHLKMVHDAKEAGLSFVGLVFDDDRQTFHHLLGASI